MKSASPLLIFLIIDFCGFSLFDDCGILLGVIPNLTDQSPYYKVVKKVNAYRRVIDVLQLFILWAIRPSFFVPFDQSTTSESKCQQAERAGWR